MTISDQESRGSDLSGGRAKEQRLDALGPQRHHEGLHLRRVRLHQSWYRAEILGLPQWGRTAGELSRPLGSILTTADAAAGLNFTSAEARHAYLERRLRGWGLEPVRCESYMTSSQTMTLNLFGPLMADHDWLARLIESILDAEHVRITGAFVEFAPPDRMRVIGDRAIADMFITGTTASGSLGLVVETKLADRFSQRHLDLSRSAPHIALNNESAIWSETPISHTRSANQLARSHALGTAYGDRTATLLVLHHPGDATTPRVAESYRSSLNDPAKLVVLGIDSFLDQMHATAAPSAIHQVLTLKLRYTEFEESDWAWNEIRENHSRSKHASGPSEAAGGTIE